MSRAKAPKRLDVSKLHDPNMRKTVRDNSIDLTLMVPGIISKNKYNRWVWNLSDYKKNHKDWFDENDAYINQLLSEKRHFIVAC